MVALDPSHVDVRALSDLAEGVAVDVAADADRPEMRVTAPATGEELGTVPACTAADVDAAVARARDAQESWSGVDVADRARVVERFHDAVLDARDELLDITQLETGKARIHAFEEVMDVALNARHYAHRAADYLAPERRKGAVPFFTKTVEHRHPVGVVGVISPWNYPLTLAVSDAIPALLAGNGVVCKPAEQTPYTALRLRELLVESGLPPECFQVVTGEGAETGPPLVDAVDFVSFTGSTETGRTVAARAGESLTECSLELGGKNPLIVRADADVERAAEGAVQGSFANAGQLCISFERIYAHEDVYEEFVEEFVARTRALSPGVDFDFDADVGSLVSADHLEKVESHVEAAVDAGANLLTGGRRRPDVGPCVFEPTVLADVPEDTPVACEETFGPVVAVTPVADDAEAVEHANDTPYGLNASIWSQDTDRAEELARALEYGTVNVNDGYIASWASVDAPMGGRKDSGLGRRHGRQGFVKYTEAQTVATQRGPSLAPPRALPYGLYVRAMTAFGRLAAKVPGLR